MSVARTQRRHPKLKDEDLPTTRGEVVAFVTNLTADTTFCSEVLKTARAVEHQRAIVAEHNRREALPRWRKALHRLWLRFR